MTWDLRFNSGISRCQCRESYRIIPSTMTYQAGQSPVTLALREEFRSHLETFYSRLKLAPPYESVEKAIRSLTTALHGLPEAERARLSQESGLKWEQFRVRNVGARQKAPWHHCRLGAEQTGTRAAVRVRSFSRSVHVKSNHPFMSLRQSDHPRRLSVRHTLVQGGYSPADTKT
jgi:hypothetical protein